MTIAVFVHLASDEVNLSPSWVGTHARGRRHRLARTPSTGLYAISGSDVVTPIGPFCPFRSEACRLDGDLGLGMGTISEEAPQFATEMARMQLDFQMGQQPDKDRVR